MQTSLIFIIISQLNGFAFSVSRRRFDEITIWELHERSRRAKVRNKIRQREKGFCLMDGKSFKSEEAIKIRLGKFLIHFQKQNDFLVHSEGVAV